jgi:hypothetical protein
MARSRLAPLPQLLGPILACTMYGGAHAAELGEAMVRSYLGQQLVANIELAALDEPALLVQVRLASPDVYRGASLGMSPVLSSLNMSVMRRDGRQFLHITSLKPVESEHLHLFLELGDGGRRSVRLATLSLSPDPHPAPPPLPPQPPPEPARTRVATPEPEPPPRQPEPVLPPKPAQAPPARLRPPVPALAAALVPARLPVTAGPAACVKQYSSAQIKTCAALDDKNAALTAQLVDLEAKVKVLQTVIGSGPAAAPASPQAAPAQAAAAVSKSKPQPGKKAAAPALWLWIAGAALLVLGGASAYALVRRKKKVKPAQPAKPAKPGFIASVKNRLRPGSPPAEPAEPVLE